MRWWIECLTRELPPLTVNAPRAWHICGTSRACFNPPSALSRTPVLLIILEPERPAGGSGFTAVLIGAGRVRVKSSARAGGRLFRVTWDEDVGGRVRR
jgi:hypothetical protein